MAFFSSFPFPSVQLIIFKKNVSIIPGQHSAILPIVITSYSIHYTKLYDPRRDPKERDVQIGILFCGICHSDLHTVRNEWSSVMATTYPCVPGHEIVGRVTQVGNEVTGFRPGDLVGVGCMVDSDHVCPSCRANVEQFCPDVIV